MKNTKVHIMETSNIQEKNDRMVFIDSCHGRL